MRRLLFTILALLALSSTAAHAGWGWGCGRGWGWGGPRVSVGVGVGWGGGWGGYYGPRWGGWYGGPAVYVAPPPVVVYRSVRPVRVISSSTLVRAQAQLRALGYYRGSVDGRFGPMTSTAISQFQADNGLRVTGRLDGSTLRALGS